MTLSVPDKVAAAWNWPSPTFRPLEGGLINNTYAVSVAGAPVAVLQRMHQVFRAEVNLDIDALSRHVATEDFALPSVVATRDGTLWVHDDEDRPWRALSWIHGDTHHRMPSTMHAASAAALVARFHHATRDWQHDYHFVRQGVHDTALHASRLQERLDGASAFAGADSSEWLAEVRDIGSAVLAGLARTPHLPTEVTQHCHGDLKISNMLFRGSDAVTLVDLDTIARMPLCFELGDALRSWCNPLGEDQGTIVFDLPICEAALQSYFRICPETPPAIRESIIDGVWVICLELASRFCTDVFDDNYFGWNAQRFASRRAHNLVRARRQLDLAQRVEQAHETLRRRVVAM